MTWALGQVTLFGACCHFLKIFYVVLYFLGHIGDDMRNIAKETERLWANMYLLFMWKEICFVSSIKCAHNS